SDDVGESTADATSLGAPSAVPPTVLAAHAARDSRGPSAAVHSPMGVAHAHAPSGAGIRVAVTVADAAAGARRGVARVRRPGDGAATGGEDGIDEELERAWAKDGASPWVPPVEGMPLSNGSRTWASERSSSAPHSVSRFATRLVGVVPLAPEADVVVSWTARAD